MPSPTRRGAASGYPRSAWRRVTGTLTARTVLVTCGAALIAVLVTAAVAFPLAVRAAQRQAREALAVETKVVTEVLRPRMATGDTAAEDRAVRGVRSQGIDVYLIHHGQADRPGLPVRVVRQIGAGKPVSERPAVIAGRMSLIEGRPLPGGDGVVLVQPLVTGTARQVARVLWLPLLAGLLGGAVAGALLAQRIARPLRHAAMAASRLSAGDRSVRVPVEPPAEVEDLSRALNELATALATSENRQRDFLLSISHELRTPLTTLRGYAEAVADGVIGPEDAAQAGRTMLAEAEHLDRLVADLLALARLEADEFPLELLPVDLTGLVAGAADAWRGRVDAAGLALRTELPPEQVVVHTDPGRIRQVVDGLLENALRVVPAGAPLVLAVRAWDPPGYGVVEVRDGGPGFTDEDLAVAFDRGALYQRYRGVRKVGSGLGLALAARLVRRLGGAIEAGHAAEGGARFTVRLPQPGLYQPRTPA